MTYCSDESSSGVDQDIVIAKTRTTEEGHSSNS